MKKDIQRVSRKKFIKGEDIGRLLLKSAAYAQTYNTSETPLTAEILEELVARIPNQLERDTYNKYAILYRNINAEYDNAMREIQSTRVMINSLSTHLNTLSVIMSEIHDAAEGESQYEIMAITFRDIAHPAREHIQALQNQIIYKNFKYLNAYKLYIKGLSEVENLHTLKALYPEREISSLKRMYDDYQDELYNAVYNPAIPNTWEYLEGNLIKDRREARKANIRAMFGYVESPFSKFEMLQEMEADPETYRANLGYSPIHYLQRFIQDDLASSLDRRCMITVLEIMHNYEDELSVEFDIQEGW